MKLRLGNPYLRQTTGFFVCDIRKTRVTEVPQLKIGTKCVSNIKIQFC